jgi:peroxiredoxin Q/BCP
VAYFAASTDKPETNKEFAESLGADYPILSDPEKKAARAYGVVSTLKPWASRWTFYIGRDGKILYIDKEVNPSTAGRDVAARLKALGVPLRN